MQSTYVHGSGKTLIGHTSLFIGTSINWGMVCGFIGTITIVIVFVTRDYLHCHVHGFWIEILFRNTFHDIELLIDRF